MEVVRGGGEDVWGTRRHQDGMSFKQVGVEEEPGGVRAKGAGKGGTSRTGCGLLMDLKGDSRESGASPFRPQAETTQISSASHTNS